MDRLNIDCLMCMHAYIYFVDFSVGDLLAELHSLSTQHELSIQLAASSTSGRPIVAVSYLVPSSSNSSSSSQSLSDRLRAFSLGGFTSSSSQQQQPQRVDLEFEVSAQYPHVPLSVRVRERAFQTPMAHIARAFGLSSSSSSSSSSSTSVDGVAVQRLLQRLCDGTQGFDRLTKICLAIKKRLTIAA